MMTFDTGQWVLVALGAFFIGVSKAGISGLGMLFIALFANIMPAKEASGFILPMLILGDMLAVSYYRPHAQFRLLLKLFPWTAVGVVFGYLVLSRIDDRQARLLIGGLICGMVALHVWRRWAARARPDEKALHSGAASAGVGVLSGFATLVANAAGPLMSMYFLARGLPKLAFVGTGAVFFLLLNLFKVPFMVHLGLITPASLKNDLILAPLIVAGAWVGRWTIHRINQRWFEYLALGLSAFAGIRLLI